MSVSTTVHPKMVWAQRLHTVLITCSSLNAQDLKVLLDDGLPPTEQEDPKTKTAKTLTISYNAPPESGDETELISFSAVIPLFEPIIAASTVAYQTDRSVYVRLTKARDVTGSSSFWPRLLESKDEQKCRAKYIGVDWGNWKDEDDLKDEKEEEEFANIGKGLNKSFVMSNGVNVNGGGDPRVVSEMLKDLAIK